MAASVFERAGGVLTEKAENIDTFELDKHYSLAKRPALTGIA
jgi:hypothetical protein